MAISTFKVFLMKGTGTGTITYSKLVDIKSFPDLGGDPEMLETTTLSDYMQTFIPGILSLADGLQFECNYDVTDYQTLLALKDVETPYAIWFGGTEDASTHVVTPTGENGKFSFNGKLTVYPNGGGVNEVVNMTVTIAPSSPIQFAAS